MTNEPEQRDDEQTATGDEISPDALGDTHLGKNLGQLIREIGRQQKKIQQAGGSEDSAATGTGDAEPDDPMERLNEVLEASDIGQSAGVFGEEQPVEKSTPPPAESPTAAAAAESSAGANDAVSHALSQIESVLQQFAEAERRRYEQDLEAWKAQFKKAAMLVIRKQVEAAKANWVKKSAYNDEKVAEHYKKLKSLANKVARQKVEIQKAKKELKEKLEIADRLHIEFDGIRDVLNGKLGVLDALDKTEDPPE